MKRIFTKSVNNGQGSFVTPFVPILIRAIHNTTLGTMDGYIKYIEIYHVLRGENNKEVDTNR